MRLGTQSGAQLALQQAQEFSGTLESKRDSTDLLVRESNLTKYWQTLANRNEYPAKYASIADRACANGSNVK
jgi:hypothetical protein